MAWLAGIDDHNMSIPPPLLYLPTSHQPITPTPPIINLPGTSYTNSEMMHDHCLVELARVACMDHTVTVKSIILKQA